MTDTPLPDDTVPRPQWGRCCAQGCDEVAPWTAEAWGEHHKVRHPDMYRVLFSPCPRPAHVSSGGGVDQKPPASVAVIVWGGRVLVIKRRIPDGSLVWQFPGGKIERTETPVQAAVREAWEEVGLVVEPVGVLGDRLHPLTGRHIHYVACKAVGVWGKTDPREVEDFGWFGREELARVITEGVYAPVQTYLDEVLTGR